MLKLILVHTTKPVLCIYFIFIFFLFFIVYFLHSARKYRHTHTKQMYRTVPFWTIVDICCHSMCKQLHFTQFKSKRTKKENTQQKFMVWLKNHGSVWPALFWPSLKRIFVAVKTVVGCSNSRHYEDTHTTPCRHHLALHAGCMFCFSSFILSFICPNRWHLLN